MTTKILTRHPGTDIWHVRIMDPLKPNFDWWIGFIDSQTVFGTDVIEVMVLNPKGEFFTSSGIQPGTDVSVRTDDGRRLITGGRIEHAIALIEVDRVLISL